MGCGGTCGPQRVAIVGGGSAAFAAAIRCVEAGAEVTLIEGAELIGGTCVNVGCVPSKVMVRAAEVAHVQAAHPFAGIGHLTPRIDRRAMLAQQQGLVSRLRQAKYEDILHRHPEIRLVKGWARFQDARTLEVDTGKGKPEKIEADAILLATGSRAFIPDIPGLAETPYWTSTEALAAAEIPGHLIVLGGSVVAVELAQAWRRLGTEVTMLVRSRLLSREDEALGEGLRQVFEEEGIRVMTGTLPEVVEHHQGQFTVRVAGESLHADRLLVAAGRRPNTESLALENAAIAIDEHGAILVDEHLRTSQSHVYAAGDCTNLPQYVYVAAAAGTRAAINMTGGEATLDLSVLPRVVFTDPQVAAVGITEAEALARDRAVESRTLELAHVPRALAAFDTRGFIKLVAEAESGRLLGAQVLAREGGEIIQTAAFAIGQGMTVREIADHLFPYLTLSEGLKLCAQTFDKDVTELSCCAG